MNDLSTGGTTKALTAEMGKILKGIIDSLTTVLNNHLGSEDAHNELFENKVDKEAGKSLLSDTEITRLATLSNYTHPANHPASIIVQDSNNRFVTDAEKGAWNAKQSALGFTPENSANKNVANGYAGLGSDGKLISSQLPSITISNTFVVASQAAMLALAVETGDVAVRTDLNKSFILKGTNPTVLADWQELLTPTDSVSTVFGRNGSVTAQTGDYTADQITETATRKFQTANQQAFNDATSSIQTQLNSKENSFSKNTAFNKNFGTSAGTVAEGNDSRINNGQTAYGWGNHAGLYQPIENQRLSTIDSVSFTHLGLLNGSDLNIYSPNGSSDTGDIVFWDKTTGTSVEQHRLYNSVGTLAYRYNAGITYSLLHSGNFNTYAPTLTGSGATGTWGINISGTANQWNGKDLNYSVWTDNSGGEVGGLLGAHNTYTGTVVKWDKGSIQGWLSLGSNAYTSTAYLPLTGGILSGGLRIANTLATGRGSYGTSYANLILEASAPDGSGISAIDFRSGGNYPSDGAQIYYESSVTATGETSRLVIRNENDADDSILLRAGQIVLNGYAIDGTTNPPILLQYNNSTIASINSSGVYSGHANSSSRLYSNDTTYSFGSSNPYYGYLTYNASANRWRFKVSPGTPENVEVNYADNAGVATTLSNNQSNWSSVGGLGNVVGQLAWKNYGNNHVIFDASQSTSPNGTSINPNNSQNPWQSTFPSLMGWNGSETYGLRVDSARVADSATNWGNRSANFDSSTSDLNVLIGRGSDDVTRNVTSSLAKSWLGINNGSTLNNNISGSANDANYARSLYTNYIGGHQPNPQTYFGIGIGLKVAMTKTDLGAWSDTLWINGYAGGDVKDMVAIHTLRNGQPRMFVSSQLSDATIYGTHYEVLTDYNYSTRSSFSQTVVGVGSANDYYHAAFEARGNGSSVYPGIGFHQPGVVASILRIDNSGNFLFRNQSDSSNVNISANSGYFNDAIAGSRIYAGYDPGVANSISCSDWFRSSGSTGWYNGTYGGGIYMTDSTYVRVFADKAFKVNNVIEASGSGGFASSTYAVNSRNPIWRFGNADSCGLSYFQGTAGWNSNQDAIGMHFGDASINGSSFKFVSDGTLLINGYLTVGRGLGQSYIYMSDSDEGQRMIHCNSNRIGFLTEAGAWGSYCADDGSWITEGSLQASGSTFSYGGISVGTAGTRSGNLNTGNSIAIGDSDTGFRQNGDGVLETYANNVLVKTETSNGVYFAKDIRLDTNYGQSIVGVYSSTRYQGVWSMGESWKLAQDGTSPGNLYGLSWTHTNVGGQSVAGLSHQLLVMENGITKTALGTGIWTAGNLTASGTATASGFYASSDIRLKQVTKKHKYDVSALKPISYKWKDKRDKKVHVGYSAQEVEKVLPDAVSKSDEGFLSVDYIQVLVAKIAMLEQQVTKIPMLEAEIKKLKSTK